MPEALTADVADPGYAACLREPGGHRPGRKRTEPAAGAGFRHDRTAEKLTGNGDATSRWQNPNKPWPFVRLPRALSIHESHFAHGKLPIGKS